MRDPCARPTKLTPITCLIVAVLAGSVYLNALANPFVYDDRLTVLENPALAEPTSLLAVLLQFRFRPVVSLSYALDHATWGFDPTGYHLTSLLLHAVNAALLCLLATATAADAHRRRSPPSFPPEAVGFATAALFAVHPMMTEAVGYTSGRAEVLCTTFFLAGFLAMRRRLLGAGRGWLVASLLLVLLACASKETAVLFPLVLLAYDRLLVGGDRREQSRRLIRLHLPLLALVALVAIARFTLFLLIEEQAAPRTPWHNLLTQLGVVWRYVSLLLAPVGQSLVHPVRLVTRPTDAAALLAGAALVAAMLLAFRLRRTAPLVPLGIAWFLLLLAPSSSLIPLLELMAEHRVYLASCGLFLVAAALADHLLARLRWGRVAGGAALAVCVTVLATATVARNRVWSDPLRLWEDAARKAPKVWVTQYALADEYRNRGDCPRAIPRYQRAIALVPGEPRAYVNLAACLVADGRHADAVPPLVAAARLAPRDPQPLNNLALLAAVRGDHRRAEELYAAALALAPGNQVARGGLAWLAAAAERDGASEASDAAATPGGSR